MALWADDLGEGTAGSSGMGRMRLGWGRSALIEEILGRAQGFPVDDYRRWQALAELSDLDLKLVYKAAETLMRSGDPSSMALAGQTLDGVFIARSATSRLRTAGRDLLGGVCHWDQDPHVLSAALHPYAHLGGASCAMLLELVKHPAAVVRASATQLVAVHDDAPGNDAIEQALAQVLEDDVDSNVRIAAAQGLEMLAQDDPRLRARVARLLTGHLDAPEPEVRVTAIIVTTIENLPRRLTLFAQELSRTEPAWPFVAACRWIEIETATPEMQAQIYRRLLQLQDERWAEHTSPSRYPNPAERAVLLDEAIAACRPSDIA